VKLPARSVISPRFLGAGGLSAALGMLVFLPAAWSGRIADDYVLEGTLARAGAIGWAFTHNDLGQAAGSGHFYRPIWVLWNLALYAISHSPLLAHIGNLVLFAAICLEVSALVGLLTQSTASALAAGLLFAVFPSHGESVAWISGNTDLLATALGLAAVLVAVAAGPRWSANAAVFILSLAAMLAKEVAFVLPVILVLVAWRTSPAPASTPAPSPTPTPAPPSDTRMAAWRSPRWRPAWSALAAAGLGFAIRTAVIGGSGGYGPAFTLKRLVGSAASFVLATFSAPQIPLIRDPATLIVPAALLVAVLWRAVVVWYRGDAPRRRLLLTGVGWYVVALLPVLNQPLDLNTRNGDRLLLLPSVGLVLALVTLIDVRRRWGRALLTGLTIASALSCFQNAFAWHAAGVESTRLVAQIDRLANFRHPVVALSFPTDLGAAHLFPDALENAVQESGHPHAQVITCAPVHPLSLGSGRVRFTALAGGVWLGMTTRQVPFSVGVLGANSVSVSPGCQVLRVSHPRGAGLGGTLTSVVQPAVLTSPDNVLQFDGRNFTRVPRR
jgi:hypothetical protein